MPYTPLLDEIIALEDEALVSIDDIMHKATQEHGEWMEEAMGGDMEKIINEAGDAVTNVLSSVYRLGIEIDDLSSSRDFISSDQLPQHLVSTSIIFSRLNDQLQVLRKRYTRNTKSVSYKDIKETTETYIHNVLSTLTKDIYLEDLLKNNIDKMTQRMDMYLPDIKLEDYITEIQGFKGQDIKFKDICPLLAEPKALKYAIDKLAIQCKKADKIVALDARGFIFGSLVAHQLGIPLVLARKPGKLPGETVDVSYSLEYGTNSLSIQKGAIQPGDNIAIIDDLLATGGTAGAAEKLIKELGGKTMGSYFVISLDYLQGAENIEAPHHSLIQYF